jgi:hypothetical protein
MKLFDTITFLCTKERRDKFSLHKLKNCKFQLDPSQYTKREKGGYHDYTILECPLYICLIIAKLISNWEKSPFQIGKYTFQIEQRKYRMITM